jgi:hypothetical protein
VVWREAFLYDEVTKPPNMPLKLTPLAAARSGPF